jgi:hypothetical protein
MRVDVQQQGNSLDKRRYYQKAEVEWINSVSVSYSTLTAVLPPTSSAAPGTIEAMRNV